VSACKYCGGSGRIMDTASTTGYYPCPCCGTVPVVQPVGTPRQRCCDCDGYGCEACAGTGWEDLRVVGEALVNRSPAWRPGRQIGLFGVTP
jgi:hypothetical protein